MLPHMEKLIDSEMDLIEALFYSWHQRDLYTDFEEMKGYSTLFITEEGLAEYLDRLTKYHDSIV